jgi:serine/threonine protein kinase
MVNTDDDSEVKLVDFGLSKTFGPGETCKEPFGTLCYVAPEILLQKSYDKSVDMWSLGVIIYLMLSGTLPFDNDDDKEIARKTIYDEVQMTQSLWQKVSENGKDLVLSKILI